MHRRHDIVANSLPESPCQWSDDVRKVVRVADNPALHSEALELELDRMATYLLCDTHRAMHHRFYDQKGSRRYWLILVSEYRKWFSVDVDMVDV